MRLNRKVAFVLAAVMGIFSLTSPAAAVDQPRMQAAREDLLKAQAALRRASADKGGHREKALELVDGAIKEVDRGIEYDRTHYTHPRQRSSGFGESISPAMSSLPDQPNMQQSRQHLVNALNNLNRASADKGGHREIAMQLIRDAIQQVDEGIEYDRTH